MTAPLRVVEVNTPLGTFLPQFIMGAVKENLVFEGTSLAVQEIPYDDAESRCMFDTRFVATAGALRTHGAEALSKCLEEIQRLAVERNGLDYIQSFTLPTGKLWIMDSDYYVTALLPDEY